MEGLKVKFVKPSTGGQDITEGKVYEVYTHSILGYPTIDDDVKYPIFIRLEKCLHLRGGDWIPCDENGVAISVYELLEKKVQAMSAKEVILTMIAGIKNPVMRVDMDSFGRKEEGICYGCAATNAICKIGGLDPEKEIRIGAYNTYKRGYNLSETISVFEDAIDNLRRGRLYEYNVRAKMYGFAAIKNADGIDLPVITNYNYKDENVLNAYICLANQQQ